MKKFNKNSLLFVFAIFFVIVGIRGDCFEKLKVSTIDMLVGLNHGNIYSIIDLKAKIDDITNKELSYHDIMMDINSAKENLLGTRIIEKDDTTVVKADSGSLIEPVKKLSKNEIQECIERIDRLKTISEDNGASFLYCVAPKKELYQTAPENIDNYSKENHELFLSEMANANIPVLDFAETINEKKTSFQTFYNTDHHWTAKTGFAANNALLQELHNRYRFEYSKELSDISNYNIDNYEKWFLGSKGKKAGTFFSWDGADDFELITPKFETNLTEEQPFKNKKRTGDFKETVLFMENMKKEHYKINTYATYSGGDFRLQIIRNNLNSGGKKVLLVRDSFASVVAPFLALQTSELHVCDVRNYEYFFGDKLNIGEYIKEIKPDYVVVLYTGVSTIQESNGRYDFF